MKSIYIKRKRPNSGRSLGYFNILWKVLLSHILNRHIPIDELGALVQEGLGLNPFAPSLFVFCNNERNKLKILYWEHNGIWLFYRRLDRGTFQMADPSGADVCGFRARTTLVARRLSLNQRQAHPKVVAETVI
ncbi:IS66 family insertion sequence element accessory protein TnpB [Paenibacillus athensensis]|uniref:IS66 family insertion sequence element accessory protein TnpB n=1 Tax=Paenibacillaceae TaxID=186822 RepID=UPI00142F770C|nr:IS66 family insertion sequence element accessory protein TnpB [Paenibacillus athensensis]